MLKLGRSNEPECVAARDHSKQQCLAISGSQGITNLTIAIWRSAKVTAGLAMAVFSSSLLADEWKLPDLMTLLAQHKSGRAVFVEKKYIGIIDKPVLSSGELSFTAPDRLEKRTLKPQPELMLLEGDKLTVSQAEKRSLSINLQDHPEVASIVSSIRGTLMGDQDALEKSFQLELSGAAERWQLVLVPLQTAVAKTMRRIRIRGVQANITVIDFEQADGDRSEMQISGLMAQ